MDPSANSYSSKLTLVENSSDKNSSVEKLSHGPPPPKSGVEYVNVGDEDQMEILGFVPHRGMNAITWIGIVLTAFLLRLVFHWKPEWMLKCTHVKSSLAKAQKVLLVDQYKQMFVETVTLLTSNTPGNDAIVNVDVNVKANGQAPVSRDVKEQKLLWPGPQGKLQEVDSIQFFENKKIKYLWDSKTKEYVKLRGLELVPCSYFYQQRGLLVSEQCQRNVLYGNNLISVPVQSVMKLLLLEILNPFYVFQIFSVCLWYSDQYAYYATCIVIMSAFSITTTVLQIRKNEKALRKTIQTNDVVEVWRGSDVYETISSDQLVPGDVIVIPSHGCVMHCDAVLVSGNCIVNESMLTVGGFSNWQGKACR